MLSWLLGSCALPLVLLAEVCVAETCPRGADDRSLACAATGTALLQRHGARFRGDFDLEQDLVLRPAGLELEAGPGGVSLAQVGAGAPLDLFYAFDSAEGNVAERKAVRRWLAEVADAARKTGANLSVGHRFFADEALPDAKGQVVLQPAENRKRANAPILDRWSARWLFDLQWALASLDFRWMVRADDDGFQCPGGLMEMLGHVPLDRPFMVLSLPFKLRRPALSEGLLEVPWKRGECDDTFEENWLLFDKRMAQSIVALNASGAPKSNQFVPNYLCSAARSGWWPPATSSLFDVGMFTETLPKGMTGFSWWDGPGGREWSKFTEACEKHKLLWIHAAHPNA